MIDFYDDLDLEEYKLYCMTHNTNSPVEMTRRLFN